MEQCGIAPGACDAPTPEDCADDDCDGQIDEGLSCLCRPGDLQRHGRRLQRRGRRHPHHALRADGGHLHARHRPLRARRHGRRQHGLHGRHRARRPRTATAWTTTATASSTTCPRGPASPPGSWAARFNATTRTLRLQGPVLSPGNQICTMGSWANSSCVGAITPIPEVPCDMRDNNCDGLTDENNPGDRRPVLPGGHRRLHRQRRHASPAWASASPASGCATPPPARSTAWTPSPRPPRCATARTTTATAPSTRASTWARPATTGSPAPAARPGSRCATRSAPAPSATPARPPWATRSATATTTTATGWSTRRRCPAWACPAARPVGECRQGTTMCLGGKLTCSSVGPTEEVCDGLDNNCNGSVDENLPMTGMECRPPGLPPGPILGECRPGRLICTGARRLGVPGRRRPVARGVRRQGQQLRRHHRHRRRCARPAPAA